MSAGTLERPNQPAICRKVSQEDSRMKAWCTTSSRCWKSCFRCSTCLWIAKRPRNVGPWCSSVDSSTLLMLSKQPLGRTNGPNSGCGRGGSQMWYHQKALSTRLNGSQTTSNTFNCGIRASAIRTRRCAQRLGCRKPFKVRWLFHCELNLSTSDRNGSSRSFSKKKSSSSPKRLNSMSSNC